MGEGDGETAGTHGCCDLCKMVVGAVVFKNLCVCVCVCVCVGAGDRMRLFCHQHLLKPAR